MVLALAILFAVFLFTPGQAQYLVLGGDDMDACASNGVVAGLGADGSDFLTVRAGPGRGQAEIDRLRNGEEIVLCRGAGIWVGIVYGGGRECGVSSPIVPARLYTGPCKSGWVERNFIAVTAG
ncbi:MAG: hypothetical protein ABS76_37460 [Pelagibacterium sp. SCN 64-44]|nr:MAG: hypothetical protein ABS76_37460 [Pelagibacterium sp. SCN 64-44]